MSLTRLAATAVRSMVTSPQYFTSRAAATIPFSGAGHYNAPAPIKRSLGITAVRWHSEPSSRSKVYDFNRVKSFSDSPSPDRILIDVREPSEYEAGYIPGAINIPIKSQPDAIMLPEEEFEDRFGFAKPSPDKEVVFYCKSGVRSSAAAGLAQQHGYQNVAEYRGSWLDWTKNGGETAR